MRRAFILLAAGLIAAAPPSETPTGSNIPGAHTSQPVQQVGNVNDGHSGIGGEQRTLHLGDLPSVHMDSAIPNHRQMSEGPLR